MSPSVLIPDYVLNIVGFKSFGTFNALQSIGIDYSCSSLKLRFLNLLLCKNTEYGNLIGPLAGQ